MINDESQALLEKLDFDAILTTIQAFKIKWRIDDIWREPSIEDIVRIISDMCLASQSQEEVTFSCFIIKRIEYNLVFTFCPNKEYIKLK